MAAAGWSWRTAVSVTGGIFSSLDTVSTVPYCLTLGLLLSFVTCLVQLNAPFLQVCAVSGLNFLMDILARCWH